MMMNMNTKLGDLAVAANQLGLRLDIDIVVAK